MSERPAQPPTLGARVSRAAVSSVLTLSGVAATFAALRLAEHHVPLSRLWGAMLGWWWAASLGALALCALAFALEVRAWRHGARTQLDLAPLRKFFCAAVLASALFLATLQPFRRLYFELSLGLAAGLFAALLVCEHTLAPRFSARLRRGADLALFNLCLSALVAEFVLRQFALVRPSQLLAQRDGGAPQSIRLFGNPPGMVRYGFACNSGGYYDDEFRARVEGRGLVVTIGDSFSMGSVPHLHHYTTVAERALRDVDVHNVGAPGIGPPEYLHLLRAVALPMKPDAVVVTIFVGNDIKFSDLRITRTDRGLRLWFDRDNLLVWQFPRRLLRLSGEAGLVGDAGGAPLVSGEREIAAAFPFVEDPALEEPGLTLEAFLRIERARALEACRVPAGGFAALENALLEMKAECGDVPFAVMLLPDEFQVEDPLWATVTETLPQADELQRFQPQEHLAAFAAANDIGWLDLTPALRAVEPDEHGLRRVYHLRDTHFNARGNRIAGEQLAARIQQLLVR